MERVAELSIAIPLYNEERNVRTVFDDLLAGFKKAGVPFELVLVNNGSADRTGELIDQLAASHPGIKPVHLKENQGYGGGILEGLARCTGRYIGFTAGDGQVHAEDHVRVFQKLRDESLDICKASRVERHDGFKRLLITRVYNVLFPLLFRGCPVRDINGFPKIFRREAFEGLAIQSRDWFIDAEIVIKAAGSGLKIGEVPVVFHARGHGESNVNWGTVIEFLRNIFLCKLRRGRFGRAS